MTIEEENARLKRIVRHLLPDMDAFFVCGEVGDKGPDGLPEKILICPSYGLDGFAVYTKTSDYSAPGW